MGGLDVRRTSKLNYLESFREGLTRSMISDSRYLRSGLPLAVLGVKEGTIEEDKDCFIEEGLSRGIDRVRLERVWSAHVEAARILEEMGL